MRLRRLELVGFKSFANKVKLEFHDGITAIVGPNGSGKSNISDAIRWVLGEPSVKSLRGEKLEDVIFAGSDGKRPLGMAEVQLTLDNSDGFLPVDYNEVTITRRVYRSGESEFFINRQPCRLRDIQDLFTDTGLGREGFAIIGQGQIDAVLSANSEDRRYILEETAGIIKYRHRKEQALKKMAQTEFDLVRLADILSELKEQLVPLEQQARKAREYQQLAARLEEVTLDQLALKFGQLNISRQTNMDLLSKYQAEALLLADQEKQQESEMMEAQEQLHQLEQHIDNLQQELTSLNDQINNAMQKAGLLEERLKHNAESQNERSNLIKAYAADVEQFSTRCAAITAEMVTHEQQYKSIQALVDQLAQKVFQIRQDVQQKREQLEKGKSDFIEFVQILAEARNFGRNYQQQTEQLNRQIKLVQEEAQLLKSQTDEINEQLNQKLLQVQELEERRQLFYEQIQQFNSVRERIVQETQALSNQEKTILQQHQQVVSRLHALKELEADYEGYNYSVRRLMQANLKRVQLLGTVADVIKVPEGFETAIEVALGSALQYVITPTENDAKAAIEWLKQTKSGRCTFLPLNSVKGNSFSTNYQRFWQEPDCFGPAIDLVQFEEQYLPALEALLGRVVVVKHLDAAIALQKKLPSFSRIVTLDGEVVMPNGSLTGGSLNQQSHGLLARKNEIARLEQEAHVTKQRLAEFADAKAELQNELDKIQTQLDHHQQLIGQIQTEFQTLNLEITGIKAEQLKLAKQYAAKQQQLEEYQIALRELENQAAASMDNIVDLEEEERLRRAQIADLEVEIKELEHVLEVESQQLTNQQIALTSAKTVLEQQQEQLALVQQQLAQAQNAQAAVEQELTKLKRSQTQLETDLRSTIEQETQLKNRKAQLMQDLTEAKAQKSDVQAKVQTSNLNLKALQKQLANLDKTIYNYQLELERIDLELNQISDAVAERAMTAEQLAKRVVTAELHILQKEEKSLKQKIHDLGVVNLAALQEYENVKERVSFLQSQYDDLTKAKDTLHQTITEIDATSAERMLETYKRLRHEFQIMFTQLFKGGKADLELTDPENILNSGINIIAQPPGKKLQNLNLLSGGERALTAIALLLAIRKIKPTPFCVLDEIDAALDETNLKRFVEQMRVLARSTQFLIITHRPSTMEVADRLYGVTMSNDATSQLMSVQLSS